MESPSVYEIIFIPLGVFILVVIIGQVAIAFRKSIDRYEQAAIVLQRNLKRLRNALDKKDESNGEDN